MSTNADKPEEAKSVEPPAAPEGATAGKDRREKAEDASEKGLKYVFKIAPANPKNAFDFEDIADK